MAVTRSASITVVDEEKVGVTSVFTTRGEHAVVQEGADQDEVTLGALVSSVLSGQVVNRHHDRDIYPPSPTDIAF